MGKVNRPFLLLAALCGACDVREDVVHPRTPITLAAYFSRLDVPKSAVVVRYDDGFVVEDDIIKNEGGLFITLRIDAISMQRLVAEATQQEYVSIGSIPKDTNTLWYHSSPRGTKGLYRHELGATTTENEQLIVLDTVASELRLMRVKITRRW